MTTTVYTTTSILTSLCESVGGVCQNSSNCCSGYCCKNFCSDKECKEIKVFSTFNILLIVGSVSVGVTIGYIFYTKFSKKKIYQKIEIPSEIVPEKIEDELKSLKKIAEDLKQKGYDISELEKELNMAEDDINKGLMSSAKSHLNRAKGYYNVIKTKETLKKL